ncbi:hypothetical protein GCM10009860_02910 [Microbacterium mitrae]|uniref:Tetratricopeptide repeat protein n=1 Tax=Microbacterium mitrae TaxID=664640 RepID=A0A5C8HQC6_9MICO|nr:tetratricopeptide repeat protein [Microbacterium mitrae]
MVADNWNDQIAAVWEDDALSDEERIRVIDALAATLPFNDPRGLFERGGARDAAGLEHDAIPLYLAALRGGLGEYERAQAVIQLRAPTATSEVRQKRYGCWRRNSPIRRQLCGQKPPCFLHSRMRRQVLQSAVWRCSCAPWRRRSRCISAR